MANKTRLKIMTPEKTLFDNEIDMLIMRTTSGDIGILPGHIPITTTISYGVATISDGDKEYKAAMHGGFAVVVKEGITIVTDAAEWGYAIDKKRAEEAKERAEKRLIQHDAAIDILRAEIALKRALVRLEATTYKADEYNPSVNEKQS